MKLIFLLKFGRRLDLDDPKTFSEKLQWLKLNYQDPAKAFLVDKYEVKEWVTSQIGIEHVIPTIGVYDSFDEIDFDALPDSFVLKTTHDSGGVVLCHEKRNLDIAKAKEKLQRSIERTYFHGGREPHYRDLKPRIIAEPFIIDKAEEQLRDYKFFCFDGVVKVIYVTSDWDSSTPKMDYFDYNFQWLDMRQNLYPNAKNRPSKPARFDEMLSIAEKLSTGHPHVRVDLYLANGHIYFGEMTFFTSSGLRQLHPAKSDKVLGDFLVLPDPTHG